jgi:uncharacterized protein YlaN (UPF0358 family)
MYAAQIQVEDLIQYQLSALALYQYPLASEVMQCQIKFEMPNLSKS